MTVPQNPNTRTEAVGNGVTLSFAYDFLCLEARDIQVSISDVLLAPSQYTVTGLGQIQGGAVSFGTPPPNGAPILIELAVVSARAIDYQDNGDLFAQTVNFDFDRLWLAIKSAFGWIRRALVLGTYDVDGAGSYRANNNRIQDLADPQADQDAVNYRSMFSFVTNYVDKAIAGVVGGFGWFLQAGVGAIYRTFQDKMRDTISVRDFISTPIDGVSDNQEGIERAVNAALARSANLKWPDGVYVSSASIANFHNVRHVGSGVIKRGSDLFYIELRGYATVNRIHAAVTTGSPSNDGLSSAQPISSFQGAIDTLAKWAPLSKGQWEVTLSGETHARGRFPDEGIATAYPIRVAGPAVSVAPGFEQRMSFEGRVGNFTAGEVITFSGSGATGTVTYVDNAKNMLQVMLTSGIPGPGQTITGSSSGATAIGDYISPRPTARIKEGPTESGVGVLAFNNPVLIQDVEAEDFNGTTSSSGVRVDHHDLYLINFHAIDCYYGSAKLNKGKLDIKGGFKYDCGYLNSVTGGGHAIRALFHAKLEIGTQSAGTRAFGPAMKGCSGVLRAQENTTGHLDWVIAHDNDNGCRALVNSRVNIDGSSFKRIINTAVWGTQDGHFDPSSNTVFGVGADSNGRNLAVGLGSSGSALGIASVNTANASNPGSFSTAFPNTVVNTVANTLLDEFSVTRAAINDTQFTGVSAKRISVKVRGTLAGSTGTFKRLIFRVGVTPTLISFAQSATGAFEAEMFVAFIGPNSQFVSCKGLHQTSIPLNNALLSESTAGDLPIQLQAVVNNAADSITIRSIEWIQEGF